MTQGDFTALDDKKIKEAKAIEKLGLSVEEKEARLEALDDTHNIRREAVEMGMTSEDAIKHITAPSDYVYKDEHGMVQAGKVSSEKDKVIKATRRKKTAIWEEHPRDRERLNLEADTLESARLRALESGRSAEDAIHTIVTMTDAMEVEIRAGLPKDIGPITPLSVKSRLNLKMSGIEGTDTKILGIPGLEKSKDGHKR